MRWQWTYEKSYVQTAEGKSNVEMRGCRHNQSFGVTFMFCSNLDIFFACDLQFIQKPLSHICLGWYLLRFREIKYVKEPSVPMQRLLQKNLLFLQTIKSAKRTKKVATLHYFSKMKGCEDWRKIMEQCFSNKLKAICKNSPNMRKAKRLL